MAAPVKELSENKICEWLGEHKVRPYEKNMSCRGDACDHARQVRVYGQEVIAL